MKDLIIVANWKLNKTMSEVKKWLDDFSIFKFQFSNKKVIIFPSFTLLDFTKRYIKNKNLNIEIGAQNISEFDQGAYTGQVNGKQIGDFANYVLIGHSEARKYLNENDLNLTEKFKRAKENNLKIIYCVSSFSQFIPAGTEIVAYEPLGAIGSGKPDSIQDIIRISSDLKKSNKSIKYVLYGGSVSTENVLDFTSLENIDGILVGGESLNPNSFFQIIKNA